MSREPDWGSYPSAVNEQPAWVSTDLTWAQSPDERLKTLLHVRFPVQAIDAEGLPEDDAMPEIYEAEDAIVDSLAKSLGAVHVGSVSTGGMRHIYLYAAHDRGMPDALRMVAAAFPKFAPSAMSRPDAEYSVYADLLTPNPWQNQFLRNARVLTALAEHGDEHEVPRTVEHFAYFTTRADRDAFGVFVSSHDMAIDEDSMNTEADTSTALPWTIRFGHEAAMDLAEITNLTTELAMKAEELNGEYDGWETRIVKDEESE